MSTIRTKIIRRLTRLAVRQVVRVDRALAGRQTPIRSRTRKNAALAKQIERTQAYLEKKREARAIHRPKRARTAAGSPQESRRAPGRESRRAP